MNLFYFICYAYFLSNFLDGVSLNSNDSINNNIINSPMINSIEKKGKSKPVTPPEYNNNNHKNQANSNKQSTAVNSKQNLSSNKSRKTNSNTNLLIFSKKIIIKF